MPTGRVSHRLQPKQIGSAAYLLHILGAWIRVTWLGDSVSIEAGLDPASKPIGSITLTRS